jgi:ribose transport system substrate-binding protein
MDVDLLVRADVTYPPSMITTGIICTAISLRGERLNGFY